MDSIVNYLKAQINPRENEFIEMESFNVDAFHTLVQDGFYLTKECPQKTPFMEYVKIGDSYLVKKSVRDLAWLAENGNFEFDSSSVPVYRRLLPPPAEALDHVHIIKAIASTLQNITYLEYGVSTGHSLKNMAQVVDYAIGVDVVDRTGGVPDNVKFYNMTTDEFSEKHLSELNFSMCFIDADHAFSSAYKDFCNVVKYIQPGGYIILHDTYPCSHEFLQPFLCNDCYKTPIQIKKDFPELEILTLPLQPGLTIVRKI